MNSSDITAIVERFILHHTPLHQGSRLVVGLSGGADSVALLHILNKLGYKIFALHCNFHLRGDESDRDEQHARRIAADMGVEIRVTHFDVDAHRRHHGGSVEMACRDLRYEWFEKMRVEFGAEAIAVAHHRDDNIETFMLNLLRGSSLNGLCGMEPFDPRTQVVRPLLEVSRLQIEEYLRENALEYITDSSNASNDFKRNRLRNSVLPLLEKEFPGARERIARSIELLRENREFYRRAVDNALKPCLNADSSVNLSTLSTLPQASLLLYEHLKNEGITASQASDIIASANLSGKKFPTPEGVWIIDRGILRKAAEGDNTQSIGNIEIRLASVSELNPALATQCAFFSAELMEHADEIMVRPWQKGDRIKPWGMNGSKLVSDLMTDAKIPLDRKESYPVVTLRGEILWVAGLRASRLYPIPSDATEITILSC